MAKGVEDTAFYRYTRFVALNEVGGDPAHFGLDLDAFHAAQTHRQQVAPRGMTALSTHDTKRGEDVRARLAVLSELPDEWADAVRAVMSAAPLPDPQFAYLLWQTFAGAGFIDRERMHAYAEKAMREAATSTTWTDPDAAFEAAVHAAVDAAYDRPDGARTDGGAGRAHHALRLDELARPEAGPADDAGRAGRVPGHRGVGGLARRPGQPASGRLRRAPRAARAAGRRGRSPPVDASGGAKLWLPARPCACGVTGPTRSPATPRCAPLARRPTTCVAFDRGGAITVATRLPVALERAGGWGDTTLDLGAAGTDVLTGRAVDGVVRVADLLERYPVALVRKD